MPEKNTIENVMKFVSENSDCELLSSEYINNNSKLKFRCKCGEEFTATFHNFKGHNKRQCNSCGFKEKANKKRLSFEYIKSFIENESKCKLLSLKYINNNTKMLVQCGCGNNFFTDFSHFKDRNKRQCNKCTNEILREKNSFSFEDVKKFIEKESNCTLLSSKYINENSKILIKCSCGNEFKTSFMEFKHMNKRRCNFCTKSISSSELKTLNFLKCNNIEFIQEHKFLNCKYKRLLPFDFYLPNYNICIELDGEYHFKPISFKSDVDKAISNLKFTKKRDKIKDKYCKDNNIKLIRIPYWEFKNIENILKGLIK